MRNLSPIITGDSNTQLIPANLVSPLERSETKGGDRLSDFHCHLDYLTVSAYLPPDRLDDFLNYVSDCNYTFEPDKPWFIGGNQYHVNRFDGRLNVSGGYSEDIETGMIEVMVRIPGAFWENKTVPEQHSFCQGLYHAYSVKCHRLDLAVDDYTLERIPLLEMRKAWEDGNHFHFQSWNVAGGGKSVKEQEFTHYLGSRLSDKMVRVYRHKFENKSECLRWETEYKKERAQTLFVSFCTLENDMRSRLMSGEDVDIEAIKSEWDCELQQVLGAMAVGAVDFRDRSKRKDRSKACASETERLPWFAHFVESIGGWVKARKRTVDRSVERTVDWLYRQVSGTLSAAKQALGRVGFLSLVDNVCIEGDKKLGGRHKRLIRDIQSNPHLIQRRIA